MESMIFKVRPTKEAEFAKLVKKFNRCLKANKMNEIHPVLLGECDIDIKVGSTNLHYSVKGNQYQLSFPDNFIGMDGYRFLGEYRRIDNKWHRTMRSDDIRDELDVCEAHMRCDHCGRDIKNRNGYFFFRDNENNLKVVGSTCVDAFLGYNIRELLEALGDATEFEREGGSPDFDKEIIGIGIESFVAMVADATNGFSAWKKSSEDDSTSSNLKRTIMDVFMCRHGATVRPIENASEIVEKCRNYWKSVYKYDDLSVNSRKSLEGNFVPMRWAGIAGWAVYKAVSDANKPHVPTIDGEIVGKPGERRIMYLTPKNYFSFESQWGKTTYGINFDDADGNHYKTFTTSMNLVDKVRASIGEPISLDFVVVGYDTNRGRNINKIKSARCI